MANPNDTLGRETLPIPDIRYGGTVTYNAKSPDTKYPPIVPLRPPSGAPNVLVILIDDTGFGATSAFGGPVNTPTFERLAAGGLKYTRFHTTALCSPTRAALLSGRNHHTVGMGGITEIATSAPGYNSIRPNTCAPIAETLKLNGYNTAQFGKCHEVPVWEASAMGPFDHWPHPGGGFEYFYGFLGGETNQYYPALIENTTPIEQPKTPEEGYTFNEDMADRTIGWIKSQKALVPDKPFFIYYAPGATHAPHHVPAEWADKYKGKFAQGWDKVREETFARQKELGVIPQNAELTVRSEGIPAWDEMSDKIKPVLEREMEVYAGFLEQTDHHIGRVIDAIESLGILEDTLIITIIGDNGASAEGSMIGTTNEGFTINHLNQLEDEDYLVAHKDDLGTVNSYNHYAIGWAHCMDTPYQWTKQVASHWGGTRNGTIVHWPKGIEGKGEIRNQFAHVIDVAPTILEVAKLPQPKTVNGVTQHPIEGTSFVYSFNDAQAPEQHETQYFEMLGNRAIYHQGWTAAAKHKFPWLGSDHDVDEDVWELYDSSADWTQARDLAAEHPEKVKELERLFIIQAARFNVLPLDDRSAERFNSDIVGRPTLIRGNEQILYAGMTRLGENSVLTMKNKSHAITAEVVVPDGGAEGVIVAQGGAYGGWSFFVKDNTLKYAYNMLGLEVYDAAASSTLPSGKHQVRGEFAYDGGGLGKGGTITFYVDGEATGEGRIKATLPFQFSFDETLDVGLETGSAVSPQYTPATSKFNGTIDWVKLENTGDDHSHLIDPEHLLNVAMLKQ